MSYWDDFICWNWMQNVRTEEIVVLQPPFLMQISRTLLFFFAKHCPCVMLTTGLCKMFHSSRRPCPGIDLWKVRAMNLKTTKNQRGGCLLFLSKGRDNHKCSNQFWPIPCFQGGRWGFRLPAVGGWVHWERLWQLVSPQRLQVLDGGPQQRRGPQVLSLRTCLWGWLVVLQVAIFRNLIPFDTFLPLSAASSPTWTASTSWWGRTTATTGGSSGSSGWATTPSSPPWWWFAPRRSLTPRPPYQQFQLRIPSSQPGGWIGTPPWIRAIIIRRRRRGTESGKRRLT